MSPPPTSPASRIVGAGAGRLHPLDDLDLVRLVGEQRQGVVGADLGAGERLVGLDDLAHPGLDRGEVVLAERAPAGQLEVVVEAVLDRRADRVLGAREQLGHGLGHHVRRRVAQDVAALFGPLGDDGDRRVVGQRALEVELGAVDRRRHGRLGEALADRRRHVTRRRPGRVLALGTVGEGDRDLVAHSGPSVRATLPVRPLSRCRPLGPGRSGRGAQRSRSRTSWATVATERAVDRAQRAERQAAAATGGHGHELGQQPLVDVDRAMEPHAVVERHRHPLGVVGQVGVRLAGGARRAVVAEVGEHLEVQQRIVGHGLGRVVPGPASMRDGVVGAHGDVAGLDERVVVAPAREAVGPGHTGRRRCLVLDARLVGVEVGRQHDDDAALLAGEHAPRGEAGAVAGALDLVADVLAAGAGHGERQVQRVGRLVVADGELRSAQRLADQQPAEHVPGRRGVAGREDVGVDLVERQPLDHREPVHRADRKSSSASLTSAGRSCWVQCPQPERITDACSFGSVFGKRSIDGIPQIVGSVAITADEQRRDLDGAPAERRQVLPVAIDVAVAVEPAGEPGVLELGCVHVEVVVGQPRRHRVGVGEAIADQGAVGDRRHRATRWRRSITGRREVEAEQPPTHVLVELALGPAGLLEVLDVELLGAGHQPEGVGRAGVPRRPERHRQAADGTEHVGPQQGRVPRDRRTPVVADDDGLLLAERAHESDVVGDVAQHPVVLDGRRRRRTAVAAHVDGHGPVAGGGERRQLVAPRVPRLREPVDEQHQRPLALLHDVQADAVGRHDPMFHRGDRWQPLHVVREPRTCRTR